MALVNRKMNRPVTLHFFSGKMAAGKSTLARRLAEQENAILIIEDDWLSKLYPQEINTIPDYLKYAARLKRVVSDHVLSLLSRGISVVMDFPANTIEQRNWFRSIYTKANVAHILHYIEVSDEVCKQHLKERSKDKPQGAAFTTEAEFDAITQYFRPPASEEGFNIHRHHG